MELDPFDLLGVMRTATDAEIVSAHDRLCSVFDPDRWRDASSEVQAEALRWTEALEFAVRSALGTRDP